MKRREIETVAALPDARTMSNKEEVTNHTGAIRCRNLRPARGSEGKLVPVEDFEKITSGIDNHMILGWISHPDRGRCLVTYRGSTLNIFLGADATSGSELDIILLAGLIGSPTGMFSDSPGRAYILTTGGRFLLQSIKDGGFELYRPDMEFPEVRLERSAVERFSAVTKSQGLSKSYSGNRDLTQLAYSDMRSMAFTLGDAYNSVVSQAKKSDYFVEPVLLRYKYLDRNGRVLFVSPVKCFMADSGFQMTDEYSCRFDGVYHPFEVSAEGFKVSIGLPEADEQLNKLVGKVVFEYVPMLHVIDGKTYEVDHVIDQDRGIIRMFMPGVSVGMKTDTERLEELMRQAILHFDELCTKNCEISNPFSGAPAPKESVWYYTDFDSANSCSRKLWERLGNLKQVWAHRRSQVDPLMEVLREHNLPHDFTAEVAVSHEMLEELSELEELSVPGCQSPAELSLVTSNKEKGSLELSGEREQLIWAIREDDVGEVDRHYGHKRRRSRQLMYQCL